MIVQNDLSHREMYERFSGGSRTKIRVVPDDSAADIVQSAKRDFEKLCTAASSKILQCSALKTTHDLS